MKIARTALEPVLTVSIVVTGLCSPQGLAIMLCEGTYVQLSLNFEKVVHFDWRRCGWYPSMQRAHATSGENFEFEIFEKFQYISL